MNKNFIAYTLVYRNILYIFKSKKEIKAKKEWLLIYLDINSKVC